MLKHDDTSQFCCYALNGRMFASCSRKKFIFFLFIFIFYLYKFLNFVLLKKLIIKREIIVWDSTTYAAKFTLLGHELIVNCVRFS